MSATLQIIEVESATDAERMAVFFKTIWTDGDEVVPFDLVLAAIHVGGYASIARLDGNIVGASFGFLGDFAEQRVLHSHVTAASVSGVGFELKQPA
jgi:predicted GNAT superfamily acetyltransferase